MKALLLTLSLFVSCSALADVVLPTVSSATFVPGRQWIWDYLDQTGAIYSTERYQVLSRSGSMVLIELASDYEGRQNLKPRVRILADVSKCLGAYRNSFSKRAWSMKMFYLSEGVWTELNQPNTLGFEEKFNCNPHEYLKPSDAYLTVYDVLDGAPVFQQKLWRRISASWFAKIGPQAGIAVRKDFNADLTMADSFYLRH